MIERITIRFEHELLSGVELPCLEATGAGEGPHVSLVGGIHGGEYSSITAVPVVSMPSFRARTACSVRLRGRSAKPFPALGMGDSENWDAFGLSSVLAHQERR